MAPEGTRSGSRGVLAGACGTRRQRESVPQSLARRAALLRRPAHYFIRGTGGTVLTSDPDDLEALAA
jgi:hypothetical protein